MLAAHAALLASSGRQYATLNPLDAGAPAGIALTEGNRRAAPGPNPVAGRYYLARSTVGVAGTARVYWEVQCNRAGPGSTNYSYGTAVLCPASYEMEQTASYPGASGQVVGGPYFGSGTFFQGVERKTLGTVVGTVVVRNLLDMAAGTLSQAFDGGAFSVVAEGLTGTQYPAVMTRQGADATIRGFALVNFGSVPFLYAVPTGASPGIIVP
ncbi:hypothetical protein PQS31_06280 [Luteimonas sp BLCC-B24]|uniref:hypothetical protein n=1 Tax=Luteimonas sp. BLCC-B24 TaxID=3025317 RepID=UPI00234E1061|nr:hypothetical protein [Luteimonas sp. BLCC-B24]MDC7806431.1 hypothetical protein [Luteimonas sp. BLCC-B24]